MKRVTFLLLVAVIAIGTAVAQSQSSGASVPNQTSADDATPATDQGAPNPDGTVTTPSSPTGPTAPIITLGTTSSGPVGATNATPGNQAGATNSTLQPSVSGGIAPQTVYTTPVVGNAPAMAYYAANNSQAGGRDLVVGAGDSAWAISSNTMGVAEAARLARAARANHKSRVFTNADIARLRGNAPVSTVGTPTAPVTNEQTMPASDVVPEQEGPTTPATPQGVQQPTTQPGVQQPPANQNPPAGAPKSPFRSKPSPVQPR